jgi:SAM-dependent methyltransferase
VRPRAPAELADVISQWAGISDPAAVVDLGGGTGLSAALWAGRARQVTVVEPSPDMRAAARRRISALDRAGTFAVVDATAESTGLPDGCADVVTASQAMHWFDPARVLPEIVRLLRPGGIFAACDHDLTPCIDGETDAAFAAFHARMSGLEQQRGLLPPLAVKHEHLRRLRDAGQFRQLTEISLGSREEGDAGRLAGYALSLGATTALIAGQVSEDELGLTELREVARRRLPRPRPWWWSYRVCMAVK